MVESSNPGRGWEIFHCTIVSIPALGPTQAPIQWVPGALSLEAKRPGRESDHSPPSSADIKNAWSYTSTPPRFHSVVFNQAQYMSSWCRAEFSAGTTLPLPVKLIKLKLVGMVSNIGLLF
jgi:hypothetical protein